METLNETPKVGHAYSERYEFDSEYHWKECIACGEVNEKGKHIIDGKICIVCDPSAQPTEGLIYELSDDETYAVLVAYEGTSDKIKIAKQYMGVPVTIIGDELFYKKNISIA